MSLFYTLLLCWLALCSLIDIRTRKIPNWLIAPVFLYSIFYLVMHQHSLLGYHWLDSIIALLLALLLTIPGYAKNQFGVGDVKLLMSLALASSTLTILYTIAGTALSLIVWTISQTLLKQRQANITSTALQKTILKNDSKLPYAPFVFLGFLASLLFLK